MNQAPVVLGAPRTEHVPTMLQGALHFSIFFLLILTVVVLLRPLWLLLQCHAQSCITFITGLLVGCFNLEVLWPLQLLPVQLLFKSPLLLLLTWPLLVTRLHPPPPVRKPNLDPTCCFLTGGGVGCVAIPFN